MRRLTVICCAFVLVSIATQNVRANPFLTMVEAKTAQSSIPDSWIFVTKDRSFFVVPESIARKSAKLKALMDKGSFEKPVLVYDLVSNPFNEALRFLDAKVAKNGVETWKKETFLNLQKSDLSNLFRYVKLAEIMGIPDLVYACVDLHRRISDAIFAQGGFSEMYWAFADAFEKSLNTEQKEFALTTVLHDWSRIMPVTSSIHLNPFISALVVEPNGKRVAIGTRDGAVQVWSPWTNGMPVQLSAIELGHGVSSVAFCPKENCLAAASGNTARIFQLDKIPKATATFKSASSVNSVAFSGDGSYLGLAMADGTATLSPTNGREKPVSFRHGFNLLTAIAFSLDNKLVATGSNDGNVKVWKIGALDKPVVTFLHKGTVSSIIFSSDSRTLLTSSLDKNAQIWKIEAATHPHREALFVHSGNVESAALSPNGKWVATGVFDEPARLWRPDGPKIQKPVMLSHLGRAAHVAFSPDGRYLLVASPHEVIFALLPDLSQIDLKMAYLVQYITSQNIRDKELLAPSAQHLLAQNPYVSGLLFPNK